MAILQSNSSMQLDYIESVFGTNKKCPWKSRGIVTIFIENYNFLATSTSSNASITSPIFRSSNLSMFNPHS